jgi:lambda family phage tail tape measure protein
MAFPLETIFRLGVEVTGTGNIGKLNSELDKTAAATNKVTKGFEAMANMDKKLSSLVFNFKSMAATLGVFEGLRSIVDAGVQFQQFNRIMEVSVGADKAAASIQFITDVSSKYGLQLETLMQQYGKLAAATKGTTLNLSDVNNMTIGLSKASATLGLSADGMAKINLAIQQIAQKGKVYSEELRGQLGEKLPGAFALAAKASKMSMVELNDALSKGTIDAMAFFRNFAKSLNDEYATGAEKASTSAQKAFNELANSIFLLKVEAANAGILDSFANAAKRITEEFKDPKVIQGVKDFAKGIGDFVTYIVQNADKLELLLKVLLTYKAVVVGARIGATIGGVGGPEVALGGGALGGILSGAAAWLGLGELGGQVEDAGTKLEVSTDKVAAQITRSRNVLEQLLTAPLRRTETKDIRNQAIQQQIANIVKLQDKLNSISPNLNGVGAASGMEDVRIPGNAKDDPVQNRLESLRAQYNKAKAELDSFTASNVKASSVLAGIEADLGKGGALRDADPKRAKELKTLAGSIDDVTNALVRKQSIAGFEKDTATIEANTKEIGQNAYERKVLAAEVELESKGIARGTAEFVKQMEARRTALFGQQRGNEIVDLKEYNRVQQETTDGIKFETELLGKSALERQLLTSAREVDNEVAKKSVNLTNEGVEALKKEAEAVKAARAEAIKMQDVKSKSAMTGLETAISDYLTSIEDAATATKNIFNSITSSLEDTLTTFFTTGKLSVGDFMTSIVNDVTRAMIRLLIIKPIIESIKNLMDSGGGGGFFSSIFGGVSGVLPDFVPATGSANGNIMTQDGPVKLNMYANGGIATSPQLSVFGEGRMNEAYVPLPDGRSIPVTMQGNTNSGDTNVVVNVSVEKGQADVGANNGEKAAELGRMVAGVVRQELLNQKRPGGLLAA